VFVWSRFNGTVPLMAPKCYPYGSQVAFSTRIKLQITQLQFLSQKIDNILKDTQPLKLSIHSKVTLTLHINILTIALYLFISLLDVGLR
jgi:hypothetical protein